MVQSFLSNVKLLMKSFFQSLCEVTFSFEVNFIKVQCRLFAVLLLQ